MILLRNPIWLGTDAKIAKNACCRVQIIGAMQSNPQTAIPRRASFRFRFESNCSNVTYKTTLDKQLNWESMFHESSWVPVHKFCVNLRHTQVQQFNAANYKHLTLNCTWSIAMQISFHSPRWNWFQFDDRKSLDEWLRIWICLHASGSEAFDRKCFQRRTLPWSDVE